ncbi:MAG: HAD family phosphatase [Verrucomicrobiota bacterium]
MKYFLFDIGKVLVDFDFQEFYRIHSEHSGKPIAPFSERDLEMRDAVETGRIGDAEWLAYLNEAKGLSWSMGDLVDVWSRLFSLNEIGYGLFRQAQQTAGVSVHLLSNIAKHHVDSIENNWNGFFDGADSLFLSYEIGVRKPHPDIYRHALNKLGVSSEECFFLDDLLENIEAARSLGINAYQFIPENHDAIRQAAADFFEWL